MAVSMKEVAKRSGVSIKTVSNVINHVPNMSPATRERVLEAIRELHYVPNVQARSLVLKQKGAAKSQLGFRIGCIFPANVGKYESSYYTMIFKGLENEITQRCHQLSFIESVSSLEENVIRMNYLLSGEATDAVISFAAPGSEMHRRIEHLPHVLIGSHPHNESVSVDKLGGMAALMEHLYVLGHRSFGYVGALNDDRFKAFTFELFQRGLSANPDWIAECGFRFEAAKTAAWTILEKKDRPTAIVGVSDRVAIGVMHAAYELHLRIPEDLSIAGFDNRPESEMVYPPLTTVDANMEGMGRMAVRMLLERLADSTLDASCRILNSRLIVRQSTGSPSK